MAGGIKDRLLASTFAVSLAIWSAGVAIGASALPPAAADGTSGPAVAAPTTFAAIVVRNVGAAMLLFSGVLTGGGSTLLGIGIMGVYVGATFGAAATNVGTPAALWSIAAYAPLEMLGLLLAATAGLLPVGALLSPAPATADAGGGRLDRYGRAIERSLRLFAVAVAVVLVAAVAESAVLHIRTR